MKNGVLMKTSNQCCVKPGNARSFHCTTDDAACFVNVTGAQGRFGGKPSKVNVCGRAASSPLPRSSFAKAGCRGRAATLLWSLQRMMLSARYADSNLVPLFGLARQVLPDVC